MEVNVDNDGNQQALPKSEKDNAFDGQKLAKGLTPFQIVSYNVIEFKQSVESKKDGHVGYHGNVKIG